MLLSIREGEDLSGWLDAPSCLEAGIESVLVQPLSASGITEGFILLGGPDGSFDKPGLAVDLRMFATAASLAIHQALSFAELKKSEEDLEKHRTGRLMALRQWASTIDAMDSMFVITDTQGTIKRLNRSVADKLNLKFQTIIGQPMSSFFGPLPQIDESIRGLIPKTAEVTVPFTEGTFELSCFPNIDPEGVRIGVIFIFRDITEDKRIREHLIEAEKLATLSAILSGVAHEMNNPMAAVMGFAQLAEELNADPAVNDCLTTVQVESEHLARIVKNLLVFARRSQPLHAPVSMAEVTTKTVDLVGYEMRVADIRVEARVPDELPGVLGDEQQLQQAMVTILLHIAGSTRRGAGSVSVTIEASAAASNRVGIKITAHGLPFVPSEASRMFDLPSTDSVDGGAGGVGLAMAYGIITQHGGRLAASIPRDDELVFFMELPGMADMDSQIETLPDDESLDASGLCALVADDDEVAARLVSNVLRMAGASVDVVSDGKRAWESAHVKGYDLIVTDLRMPGMDGDELLTRLGSEGHNLARRALVITGDTLSHKTREFIEETGLPYLMKPFTLAAVRRAIRGILRDEPEDT